MITSKPWWVFINHIISTRRLTYSWLLGIVLWSAWLLSISLGPGNMDLAKQIVGTDYLQFYTAGLTVRLGESALLYDFAFQSQLEQQIEPLLTNFHAFITPPFLAWLFVPFSLLPYGLSFALWSLLGLLCLWFSLQFLGAERPLHIFLSLLTWFPVFASISFGQNSLLSLLLLSSIYLFWSRRQPMIAGLVSSLLLYKPQLLLGVGLLWLLDWRNSWKSLLGLTMGGACLIGFSIWLMPEASQAYLVFARTLLPELTNWEQYPLWHLHTVRGFWLLLLPGFPVLADSLTLLINLIGLFTFAGLYPKIHLNPVLLYATAICLTIWLTPHAMIYDWVILAIPGLLIWQHLAEARSRWRAVFIIIWIVTLVSGPLTFGQLQIIPASLQISVPVLAFAFFQILSGLGFSFTNGNNQQALKN